jgi:type I restriction enzyme S subunit
VKVKPGYKQTEAGLLPGDWRVAPLGGFVRITSGASPSLFHFAGSGIPYFKVEQLSNAEKYLDASDTPYLFEHGDTVPGLSVVFAKRGAAIALNKVRILKQVAFMDTNLMALTPQDGLECEYLFYALGHIGLWRFADTTSVPQINNKHVKPLPFPLPCPPEQRAIAAALSDVDALLGGLDRLIAKKRDLKQAAMQQLLTGQTRLPGFSGEWAVKRLSSLATIAQGQVDPRVAPYRSMFLIGPEHVEGGTGKLLTRRTAVEQGAISGKYLFKKGDVVYGKINPYLRKAFLADFDGLCSADMYALRPVDEIAPGFLLAVILGREFSTYSESVSVRSGMPKINREEMDGFSTKVPMTFSEQAAIASVVSDMDAELAALQARRDKTRDLKQSMMQELLTGKTRLVPAGAIRA